MKNEEKKVNNTEENGRPLTEEELKKVTGGSMKKIANEGRAVKGSDDQYKLLRKIIMETKKELDTIKKEVENLNEKLSELDDEEMAKVSGGLSDDMAKRVIRGDYGNGQERRRSLREAGFDYGNVKN